MLYLTVRIVKKTIMLIEQRIVNTCVELINSGVKMLTLEHGILLTH